MTLPPRYTVRDYLKQQQKRLAALSEEETTSLLSRFREKYRRQRVTSESLRALAEEYAEYLRDIGGFSIATTYTEPTKLLPHREKAEVSGFVLEPISLGQGWVDGQTQIYAENAVLLRSHVAQFRRKKATIGEGPACVALTQHLLERVYERTEIERTDLRPLLERETGDLLRALALAERASLWINHVQEDGVCRITAVPYSNGLLIANERYLYGDEQSGGYGFRSEIPSGRMQHPFVNSGRIMTCVEDRPILVGEIRPLIFICGVTYFSAVTLSDDQADYYYSFRALLDEAPNDLLDALARAEFAPSLAHEVSPDLSIASEHVPRMSRLERLLNSGWLKPKATWPSCLLLPYNYEVPRGCRTLDDLAAILGIAEAPESGGRPPE